MRIAAAAALLAVAASLLAAPPAAADGDPASDVLLTANLYVPYLPKLSPPFARALRGAVVSARRHGYPVKVVLIASKIDLGSVALLFGQPQRYARFLALELRLLHLKDVLVVVMPHGIGAMRLGARPVAVSAPVVVVPRGRTTDLGGGFVAYDPDTLARAAIVAIGRLAASAGRPLPAVAIPRSVAPRPQAGVSGGRSWTTEIVAALAALLAAALIAGLWRLRRR
jgi:hypothetical protein